MKMKIALLMFAGLSVLTSGCKKDDPDPTPTPTNNNLNATAVGNYDYVLKIYEVQSNGTLVYTGESNDEEGELVVAQNPSMADRLDFIFDDENLFSANGITGFAEGFVFNIPSTVVDDVNFVGEKFIEVSGTKHHGYYAKGKMDLALRVNDGFDEFVAVCYATKK